MDFLEFVETPIFSRRRAELMSDDDFQQFQTYLLNNPQSGDTISKTGGCQKIRWGGLQRGKRGGIRVICFVVAQRCRIWLLLAYSKNEKDDLSESEKTVLKMITAKLDL
ncbi:type II toxin-antitoxin system RelE/ParE family toxin [Yersinia intermedia]|uniref:type II toxin-antitoxin system RelE/ParE family toxin n=1 Tax=Yersinia intermedia TaxID=631 RepID=UPI0022FE2BD3|nr:type II toxin-antitoxin system RelE/ParE family toxin [Yersinia intermedia]MDA5494238.1 type II toxin-antitoxin system RelE/ParE family toxin [Yersinia intermedia]